MNELFKMFGNGQGGGIAGMVSQLRTNPAAFLMRNRLNVPQGMTDPNAIMTHLAQTGQINQNMINQAYNIARQMGLMR